MLQSLKKLFAGGRPQKRLFESVVTAARQPHWYREGQVPDTLEGRFAVLATLTALVTLRLEAGGGPGRTAAVGLTECFIDEMDGEVRQMGIGDPTISKQVGAMVGALGGRIGRFRRVIAGEEDWAVATATTLDRDDEASTAATGHNREALQGFWDDLGNADLAVIAEGSWR